MAALPTCLTDSLWERSKVPEATSTAHHSSNEKPSIAKELGVSDNSLRSWVKQFDIGRGDREELTTEEQEELRRLRKEVKILR